MMFPHSLKKQSVIEVTFQRISNILKTSFAERRTSHHVLSELKCCLGFLTETSAGYRQKKEKKKEQWGTVKRH